MSLVCRTTSSLRTRRGQRSVRLERDVIQRAGNIWEYKADWICIPTNGFVKKDGSAVMGRDLAHQAKSRFKGIDEILGRGLEATGNTIHVLRRIEGEPSILPFPVKEDWGDPADLDLIRRSCRQLRWCWRGAQIGSKKIPIVVLPRVGCGNGRRRWDDVSPILQEELPEDSFVVVSLV